MGKYYCLIAGLPNIALDDSKQVYSVAGFGEELAGLLSAADKKLLAWFYRKYDNRNLLAFLDDPETWPDERGLISRDEMAGLYRALKEDDKVPRGNAIPRFYTTFLRQYLAEKAQAETQAVRNPISWEDRLAALYYAEAMKCGNRFVEAWFEFNLNIKNVLTALTCRKFQLDKSLYIVGDHAVADAIRTSNARDFGLTGSLDYFPELQRIAEEPDLLLREKKIDLLKWNWLEEQTFFKTFDIESVLAYLLKLEMIERWVSLDKTTGEQTFRELVGTLKKAVKTQGDASVLDRFEKNAVSK